MMTLVAEPGSRRGTFFYHMNGYFYHKYKENPPMYYFRCKDRSCNALGVLSLAFELTAEHNHPPDFERVEYLRERRMLVNEAAASTSLSLRNAFERSNNGVFEVEFESLRPALTRARLNTYPDEPDTLLLLDGILTNPSHRSLCAVRNLDDSLYRGSVRCQDGSIVMLLLSKRCSAIMKWVPSLHVLTLSVPLRGSNNSCQVHVIGTALGNTAVPLAFLLLERTTLEAFTTGLSFLRAQLITWSFRTVTASGDAVQADAYKYVFGVTVQYPLYQFLCDIGHVSKRIFESLQGQVDAAYILDLFCGLQMVPQNMLSEALTVIERKIEEKEELTRHAMHLVLSNISLHWINSAQRGPTFSICGNSERSNNYIDKTKAKMERRLIQSNGTGLYGVLSYFKQIEETAFSDVTALGSGRQPRISRRIYSLSQDAQIIVLTKVLTEVPMNLCACLENLMATAGAKKKHIFTNAMMDS